MSGEGGIFCRLCAIMRHMKEIVIMAMACGTLVTQAAQSSTCPIWPEGKIPIRRSDEADYEALLLRLTKRVSRNGALFIHVTDETGRLFDGRKADYFTFRAEEGGSFVTVDERKLSGQPIPDSETED